MGPYIFMNNTVMINSFEVALGILRRYHMQPLLRQYRYIVDLLT